MGTGRWGEFALTGAGPCLTGSYRSVNAARVREAAATSRGTIIDIGSVGVEGQQPVHIKDVRCPS